MIMPETSSEASFPIDRFKYKVRGKLLCKMNKTKPGWEGAMTVHVLTYSKCQKPTDLISTLLVFVSLCKRSASYETLATRPGILRDLLGSCLDLVGI